MIKVLFLVANPMGTAKLALDEEIRAIDAKIRGAQHRDRLNLVSHWAVRLDDLSGLLMRQKPHIVHFSGHGAASGAIVLVGSDGTPKPVPPEALAGLFGVLKDEVRVVVLNACYSEAQAKAIVKEIDCAIGMSAPIGDEHAIAFASEFYQALGYGKSVQDAYDLGAVRLIGEGVADAKRLVKLHKRKGANPSEIVLVELRCEPASNSQSQGTPVNPEEKTPSPAVGRIEDEIRAVLRPLMGDKDSRRARLTRAFDRYPGLLDRISLDGETGVFLSLLLKTLHDYGELEAGVPAVRVLLESVQGEVGAGDREKIDQILGRLYPLTGTAPANFQRPEPESLAEVEIERKPMSHKVQSSSNPPPGEIDFLILTPLQEERDAVLRCLGSFRKLPPSEHDIRVYYASDLPATFSDGSTTTYRVVVAPLLGMGRVEAANATGDAIRRWRPRYILLIGIAGGLVKAGVGLGDVLVSDQVVDYELQKLTEETKIRWQVHRVDPRLLGAAQNVLGDEWQQLLAQKRPGRGKPRQHFGPICTGDKVIANGLIDEYREVWSKLIGVEMEAGGTASAAFQAANSPGFFMIRGVSDLADGKKDSSDVAKWRLTHVMWPHRIQSRSFRVGLFQRLQGRRPPKALGKPAGAGGRRVGGRES